ncbi:MAG: hypothetical protein ABL908_10695 [Hyphomicrobium sp.]
MDQPTHSSPLQPAPPPGGGVPPMLRFLALNLGVGVGLGIAFAALIVLGNVGELKTLIAGAENPWLAIFLLYFMCALTFGSLAMGVAVMSMPYDEQPGDDRADGAD